MINTVASPNSSAPTTAQLVGGVYNQAAPVLISGQGTFLQVDVNGKLLVNDGGGGGGLSDVNITEILGSPVGLNNPLAVELSDGTNPFGTVGNPIYVTGGSGGTQYIDETAETAGAFTGTVALGYNGTDVVGLRLDPSNNLLVDLATALPAGSNLIGSVGINGAVTVQQSLGSALHVDVDNFPATQPVSGVVTADIQDTSGNPLTSTTGSLNVNITNGLSISDPAEGIPGQIAPIEAIQIGGVDDSGLLQAASVNTLGQQRIDGSLFFEAYASMIQELRSIRFILTSLATQDGSAKPDDFNPAGWDNDYNSTTTVN